MPELELELDELEELELEELELELDELALDELELPPVSVEWELPPPLLQPTRLASRVTINNTRI